MSVKDPGKALKEILAHKECPGCVLIISLDQVRRERAIKNILKKYLPGYDEKSSQQSGLNKIDAAHLNASKLQALRDEALSISLFSGVRFFTIYNVQEMPAALAHILIDLLKEHLSKTTFILCATKLPANSALLKFASPKGALIDIPELKSFELQRWTQKELKHQGIETIDQEIIHSIIQSCESDPDNISSFCEKLALYLDGAPVTLAELAKISKQAPDSNEFALIDMLSSKQVWKHEVLIDSILASGKSPFALLALLARNYTNYLRMASMREQGMQAAQIRQALGLPPWLFNKQYESSLKYNSAGLVKCMEAILIADSTLKNRSLGAEAILSELSYQLTRH